ncbi:HAD-IIB family hydrolase [Zooshikella harenae]|uniref:HAD-IIB family hydrolase n=1 Tax=Zooshikella harenae TaxID=2827238 RepID=A0ABS5ZBE7_9GAMM|nr:HAD-IIB family hydrolase [Zooshikella harenae]MBU2711350.1 HAD-IIB family hydrolase [Zooshikella harenae]
MKKLIIFTDLDATLLDHKHYEFTAAQSALSIIASHQIPLILNTSKTVAETHEIRKKLNIYHPFIIENGSGICYPSDYFSTDQRNEKNNDWKVLSLGQSYQDILDILAHFNQIQPFNYQSFNQLSAEQIAELTGLSVHQAHLAKQRSCTEPFLWKDTADHLTAFIQHLQNHQLHVTQGGRFYHISSPCDKGKAMQQLLADYQQAYPTTNWLSIALGDSPNDYPMLKAADIAVVIKPSTSKPPLSLTNHPQVIYTTKPGPEGWQQAMEQLFNQFALH